MNLRYYGFWIIDALKGAKIKKNLNEIKLIQESFSSSESKSLQDLYLSNLLKHATESTIFYEKYKNLDIKNYPIIDKNDIRNNKSNFQSCKFKSKYKKHVSSSGSTGATISIYHNKNKVIRNTADNIYFSRLAGYNVGQKLYYIRVWWFKIKKISNWFKNISPLDVLQFSDNNYMSKFVKNLSSNKESKCIIGYASALENICTYLEINNAKPFVNPKLKSVIAISESLSDNTKEKMRYYFNATVYSRYSNSENGIIAQQVPNSKNKFEINFGSYYVEILKLNKDVHADSNEIGRIVVTDLFNYSMPMIRYDTGDIGSIDYKANPPVFNQIDGRKSDIIYDTKGESVSSMLIIRPHLSKGVIQSQLIQEGKNKYTLKLNVTKSFSDEHIIIDIFKSILGNDSNIIIEYVNDIPILASGKRRATINNYIK